MKIASNGRNERITLIQRLNDVLAIVFICATVAYNNIENVEVATLLMFTAVTLINAYKKNREITGFIIWGFIFYGYCLLSIFWAYDTDSAFIFFPRMIKMIIVLVSISLYSESEQDIRTIFISLVIGAVVLVIRLLISAPLDEWGTERLGASIEANANDVGLSLTYASIVCLYYAKKTNIYGILFLVLAAISLFSGSRKAFTMLILAIVLFLINRIKKPSHMLYILPFGTVLYLLIFFSMNNPQLYYLLGRRIEGLLNLFGGEGTVDSSALKRMDMISFGMDIFKDRMIAGYGLNNFKTLSRYEVYSHNNYVELLVNHGILGILLFHFMPLVILIKSVVIWVTKTRDVFLSLVFMIMLFIIGYGAVLFDSTIILILIAASYQVVRLYSKEERQGVQLI